MKKIFLLSILLIGLLSPILATNVDVETAKLVAKNLYIQKMGNQSDIKYTTDVKLNFVYEEKARFNNSDVSALYYVFNVGENNGYVIVAGDDNVYPILGYSLRGEFEILNQPPAFRAWINNYEKQIISILNKKAKTNGEISLEWELLKSGRKSENKESKAIIDPLISARWGQGKYYNQYCPDADGGPDDRTPVGCVATAMGQIMQFHKYPEYGNGSHSYYDDNYGYQSADFGNENYDWNNMPNSLYTYGTAVPRLLYHCGVSVDMDYEYDGSGSSLSDARDALVNYFRYSSSAEYVTKNSYSDSEWNSLLYDQLYYGHPVIYRGDDGIDGHAFICDGYNGSNYFHFNWGWNGQFDGYFYLSSLNPSEGYSYSESQKAIINVYPGERSINVITPNKCTKWTPGSIQTIKWSSTGIGEAENLIITLQYGNYSATEADILAYPTLNDGEETIVVPDYEGTILNAFILISYPISSPVANRSADFMLTDGDYVENVLITKPDESSVWMSDIEQEIIWESENLTECEELKIELFDGESWVIIEESIENLGSYTLSLSDIPSTSEAKIRIYNVLDNEILDESEYFTIKRPIKYIDINVDQTGIDNCITDIENTFPEDQVNVFPNPNQGIFTLSMNDIQFIGELKLLIFDDIGRIVYSDNYNNKEEFSKTINLSEHKGIFLLTLIGSEYKFSCKLIIN